MVIDFHAHAFPDKVAARALSTIAGNSGQIKRFYDGTVGGLLTNMDEEGVDLSVVLNIATTEHQHEHILESCISIQETSARLIPFASVHPKSQNAIAYLDKIASAGIKGIKLHPEYQQFDIDDPAVFPVYEKIAELGLITVLHTGLDIGMPLPCKCRPAALKKALPLFGNAPVIAAHLGGYTLWEETLECLAGEDLYFDTSFSYGIVPIFIAQDIIKKHGADKVVFGTDLPWHATRDEFKFIDSLQLSSSELDAILYQNAQRLLGLAL